MKSFQLHISPDHFPGYTVSKPFYIYVQYSVKDGGFDGVTSVQFPFSAIGTLYNSNKLKQEIEAAAINNFNSLVKPKVVDLNDEAYNNLKHQITY